MMFNNVEEYLILKSKNSKGIIIFTLSMCLLVLLFIYIIFNYNYKTYCQIFGIYNNNYLSLITNVDDLKYIVNNNYLQIDNKDYYYDIFQIEDDLIVENNNNYKKINIKVSLPEKLKIKNNIIEGKIKKEDKKIVEYILDYF